MYLYNKRAPKVNKHASLARFFDTRPQRSDFICEKGSPSRQC